MKWPSEQIRSRGVGIAYKTGFFNGQQAAIAEHNLST